jgi:hypothetical protein
MKIKPIKIRITPVVSLAPLLTPAAPADQINKTPKKRKISEKNPPRIRIAS